MVYRTHLNLPHPWLIYLLGIKGARVALFSLIAKTAKGFRVAIGFLLDVMLCRAADAEAGKVSVVIFIRCFLSVLG